MCTETGWVVSLVLALIVGGSVGAVILGMMASARSADDSSERHRRSRTVTRGINGETFKRPR